MISKRERHLGTRKEPSVGEFETRREIDPENARAALLILGIAERDPEPRRPRFDGEQLLLAPWAVQAAMSRRHGGERLIDKERDEVTRRTRDEAKIRWQRGGCG